MSSAIPNICRLDYIYSQRLQIQINMKKLLPHYKFKRGRSYNSGDGLLAGTWKVGDAAFKNV